MPALDRNVKVTCGTCGTSKTKQKLSRHKNRAAVSDHCIVQNAKISLTNQDLNQIIKFLQNMQHVE